MISYTKRNINLISLIISVILFGIMNFMFKPVESKTPEKEEIKIITKIAEENELQENEKSISWEIEIPAIELKAEIAEGTDTEILNKYVGHFEETSKDEGNIGLAAHNRGYAVNYFEHLKDLKKGDKIYYKFNNIEKMYEVETMTIIKDTDWSYLEESKEDKITLITCVENQPNYRRCIQATE